MKSKNKLRKLGYKLRRMVSLTLAAFLVLQGMPPETVAAKDKTDAIYVRSLQDFLNFAKECDDADYSVGKAVYLQTDLDLGELPEGETFQGITSFSGSFYGYFHAISGLDFTEGGETVGLFRYVERGAMIRDLTVKGTIDCSDARIVVGGIAGFNAGTIRDCIFRGGVSSLGEIGAIAGVNGADGSIIRCQSFGSVSGIHGVGGIAGENRGVISDCTNSASVNAGTRWLDFEEDEDFSLSVAGIWTNIQEKIEEGTDFGGISGLNGGVIAGCVNKAVVGYQHAGKNVGGITGRQSGTLINCTNEGRIYGKQDVGGIVGQLEPLTTYEAAEALEEKVDELHDLMNRMIGDMESMGDELHGDFRELNETSRAAGDTADALLTEMREVIEKNVEVINELARRIDYAMTHFGTVTSYLNRALDQGSALLDDMDQLKQDLDLYDQMGEEDYDASKNRRLALESGLGGTITADNLNPAQGEKVTIRIRPENGYRLHSLTKTLYGRESEDVTALVLSDSYVLDSMPAENVTITAVFQYAGAYVLQSDAGGKAFLSEDGKTLRLEPSAGYQVDSVTISGGSNLYEGGEEVTLPDPPETGEPEVIYVSFTKENAANRVHVTSGTGGTISAEPAMAMPGETVTLHFTSAAGYEPDPDSFSVRDASGSEIPYATGMNYSFSMPEGEAWVEGSFRYVPDEHTEVYAISNPGGKATALVNPATDNVRITISCDSGYDVEKLVITDGASPEPGVYEIFPGEMTKSSSANVYTYDFSASTLEAPTQARVIFRKKDEGYYGVMTSSGVGGTILADKTMVKGGDVIRILAVNDAGYVLSGLWVSGEDNLADQVEDQLYEYQVPEGISGAVEIRGEYRPVKLVLESKMAGGEGNYVVDGQDVIVSIAPDAGYSVAEISLTDENGRVISLQKKYDNAEIYHFAAEELSDRTGHVEVCFSRQSNRDAVKDAKEDLKNETDNVADGIQGISSVSEEIRELLTDAYGNARKPEDLTAEEIERLGELLAELAENVADTGAAAGTILGDANTIVTIMGPYAEEAMENTREDLDQLSRDARAMSDSLNSAGKELQGILDYLNALDKLRAYNLSKEFDHNADQLKLQLDDVADLLDRLNQHTYLHSQTLEADMRAVNDKLNEVLTLLVDRLNNVQELMSGEDVIIDLSAEDPENATASKVLSCSNSGVIFGDGRAGGIAGTMGVEEADSLDKAEKLSVGRKRNARSVMLDCVNTGFVTVKNEMGGGIVGNLEIGYLKGCMGSGRVMGEEADCVGGVAGRSAGTIDGCSSMAVLKGVNCVGGIAGQGSTIRNCYSMVTILDAAQWVGAIAGKAEFDEDEEDLTLRHAAIRVWMSGNYYVSSTLHGVNGVSFQGAAQAITYRELLDRDDVPGDFEELSVTFIDAEQNVIRRVVLPYGSDLSKLEYPELKAGEGDYVNWSGLSGNRLEGNLILEASENTNVTILSGSQQGSEKPVILAKGTFKEDAWIEIQDYAGKAPENAPLGSVCHFYRVILKNTDLKEGETTPVRILREEQGNATVYWLDHGKWTKLPSKSLGSYEEVEMLGTEGIFCIATLQKETPWAAILIISGLTIVIVLLLVVIRRLVKGQRKKEKPIY